MKRFAAIFLCIGCVISLFGCSDIFVKETEIEEYGGTPLTALTFETVDYMGGATTTYVIDFSEDVVKRKYYKPWANEEAEFEVVKEFTDEDEKRLIDKLYTYGLFDIDEEYPAPPNIDDGGEWTLSIKYKDGATKSSRGINNSPDEVFKKCAEAFYSLCGDGIVAYVRETYYKPPAISIGFRTSDGGGSSYQPYGVLVDYSWNGFENLGNDIYSANASCDFIHEFADGVDYTLVLFTGNYGDYDRFKTCTVTSYDYNEGLTNEAVVYNSRWFKQTELELKLDKIYVVRLDFKNGDFVEYTFNTVPTK